MGSQVRRVEAQERYYAHESPAEWAEVGVWVQCYLDVIKWEGWNMFSIFFKQEFQEINAELL